MLACLCGGVLEVYATIGVMTFLAWAWTKIYNRRLDKHCKCCMIKHNGAHEHSNN